mmetsp:Transcript_17730/g.34123  ORF Transcript_17730/g.34123 Transcript_17730/m.34123 type:complete len:118 (+) Transcript_17730:22-375(+)
MRWLVASRARSRVSLSSLTAGTVPASATCSMNSKQLLLGRSGSNTCTSLGTTHGGSPETVAFMTKAGREESEDLHCHSCQLRHTTRQFPVTQRCELGEDAGEKLAKINLLQHLRNLL